MKKNIVRKGLVLGIIVLFVGASIIPTTICAPSFSTRAIDTTGYLYVISRSSPNVYRSIDQGVTWQYVGSLPTDNCWGLTSDINGSLYAIHLGSYIFRSTDQGVTWQQVGGVGTDWSYGITSDIDGSLYTIKRTNGYVFRSTDQGVTWQQVGSIGINDCYYITSDANGSLYTIRADNGYVFRSTDQGVTWQQVGGVNSDYCYGITSDIKGYLYTISAYNSWVYRSIDQGVTWQYIGSGLTHCWGITSDINGSLYILNDENGYVFRSTDGGFTWQPAGYIGLAGCYGITSGIWPPSEDIPPEISDVTAQPDPQRTGGWVNISCNVTDNVLVDTVKINVTYPDGGYVNVTMSWISNTHSYYYNTTYAQLGIYDYFIWAKDPSRNTNISNNYTFEILSNFPYTPSNPDPQNGAINVSLDANLSWDGGDPDSNDTVYYDVYFGINPNPPFKERIGPHNATQTRITYDPGVLNYHTHYYWKIIAEDNNGETSEGPIWNFNTEQYPPIANFTYTPPNPTKNDIIQFTDTSVDPDGTVVSWWWDFGDEYYSSKQNPAHQYYEDGTYNTSLTVTDNNDSTDTIQKTIVVSTPPNNPPNAPTITGETNGKAGTEYEYTFVTTDPEDDNVHYYIEWGDGNYEDWFGPFNSDDPQNKSHVWQKEDTYTIRCKAKDVYGEESVWGTLEVSMPVNQPSAQSQNINIHSFIKRLMFR